MGPDQFTVEGPLAANALQAATVAPVAEEAWVDGAAPVYSATDGKLHPVVVQPAGGAIVSVTGVSPIGVSPGVAPVVSLSGVVDVAHGGTASSTGDASLLTNIPAAQISGDVPLANVAVALAAGGGQVKGTVLTATTRLDAPTVGTSSATQHALPSGTADLLSADSSAVVTNKTISGSSNTLSNIGNGSLTNSSVTVSAGTGLAGGGAVALGSSTSLSMPAVGTAGTYAYPASVTTDDRGRVSAVTAGTAPAALPLSRANGGLGSDVSALSTGLLAQTASNTWAVRSVAQGTGITVTNGDGVSGNPTVAVDSSVVALLSGAQTFTGQKTFPSAGASAAVIPAIRQTSAGNDITVPAASAPDSFALLAQAQALTNKTISGSSNTLSNIGNSSLTNSSVTVSAGTGLSGGGAVSLGGSTSLAVSYGTTSTTATVGNDARLNPAPSTAGKIPYDTGSGYSETATGGSTTTVLHGGTTPAYAAVSLTADVSGTLPVSSGGTGQTTLSAHCVLIGEGTSGISVAAQGTSGQVLTSAGASADPAMLDPITGASAESVLGSTYTVSADNGAYEDSGLSVTLPSAGTYFVITQVRANIVAVSTAGAYLLAEYYNSTDAAAVTNSEQMCAYASTVGASYYGMPTMVARITVAASKVIKLYVKSVAPTSTSTRTFNSDANGRTKMYYLKTNYV